MADILYPASSTTLANNLAGGGAYTLVYQSAANTSAFVAAAASSILVTDGSNVPSLSTTLPAFTAGGHITMADAKNIVVNATTGTKIGTATTQKIGFWNATPIVQPSVIAAPAGGATVDAEARTFIGSLRTLLINAGLMASS